MRNLGDTLNYFYFLNLRGKTVVPDAAAPRKRPREATTPVIDISIGINSNKKGRSRTDFDPAATISSDLENIRRRLNFL